jgi:hypothetical protein
VVVLYKGIVLPKGNAVVPGTEFSWCIENLATLNMTGKVKKETQKRREFNFYKTFCYTPCQIFQ